MTHVRAYKVVIDLLWRHPVNIHPVDHLGVPSRVKAPVEFREAVAAVITKTSVD
jgi:hypothetical protein